MKHSLFIKSYFPIQFMVLGGGLILLALFTFLTKPLIAIPALFFGILFISTHYRIEVYRKRKFCHDYLWILGFKKGKKVHFDTIEYIFITSSSQSQEWGSVSARFHGKTSTYYAFLKLSNDKKMMLKESYFYDDLRKEIRTFARNINVEVRDLTQENF